MKKVIGLFPAICSLALVVACADSPTAPAPRSPSTAAPGSGGPPPGPLTNAIAMHFTPASGAVVQVVPCSPGGIFYCTGLDQVTGLVDVVVDRDIPNARVSIEFMDGLRTCATASVQQSLVAGRRTFLQMRVVNLSGEPDLLCPLPVTTNTVRVQILQQTGGVPASESYYTQTLPHVYTFAWPE